MYAFPLQVCERALGPSVLGTLIDASLPGPIVERYLAFASAKYAQDQVGAFVLEKQATSSVLYVASSFMYPLEVHIQIVDGSLAREISLNSTSVDKKVEVYSVLKFFGGNLVSSRGAEWARHRKVCTSAFSKSNLRLVRQVTVVQTDALLAHWASRKEIRSDNGAKTEQDSMEVVLGGNDDLMRTTMGVFGNSIFGAEMNVFEDKKDTKLDSFSSRLMFTNAYLHILFVVPRWMGSFVPFFKRVHQAFDEMGNDMGKMLNQAKTMNSGNDLLSLLARSNSRVEPVRTFFVEIVF